MKVNSVTTNVGDIYRILPSRRLTKDQNWEYLLLTWCRLCPLPVSSSFIEPLSYPYWGKTIMGPVDTAEDIVQLFRKAQ